jgi:hypothetical protein
MSVDGQCVPTSESNLGIVQYGTVQHRYINHLCSSATSVPDPLVRGTDPDPSIIKQKY